MNYYSNFISEHIYNIIKIIKEFIFSLDIESEDEFLEMSHKVEIEAFCLPDEVGFLIFDFIDNRIKPVVDKFKEDIEVDDLMDCVINVELEFDDLIAEQIKHKIVC